MHTLNTPHDNNIFSLSLFPTHLSIFVCVCAFVLQLLELSSKLEDLQEDKKDSEGIRNKLKRENTELKERYVCFKTVDQHVLVCMVYIHTPVVLNTNVGHAHNSTANR